MERTSGAPEHPSVARIRAIAGRRPKSGRKSLEDEPAIMVLVMLEEAWSEEGRALVVRRGARMIRAGAESGVAHG